MRGVDAFLIETCQDPLQIKAAVNGAKRARAEAKRDVPIIVQVTVETTGTLLVGADIAAAATILTTSASRYHDVLATHVTMYDATARRWLAGATAAMRQQGASGYTAHQRALDLLNVDVTRQAVVLAYNHVFLLIAGLFVLVTPLVLLLRPAEIGGEREMIVGE